MFRCFFFILYFFSIAPAAAYAQAKPSISADPNRLCILGGSYGGYAALQSLVKEPGLYKRAVAMAPRIEALTISTVKPLQKG
ncbi:MAG: S9 family peptidase [Emcibacter sp.]|nr:S9 family peptidase [Emcibacter sp.]